MPHDDLVHHRLKMYIRQTFCSVPKDSKKNFQLIEFRSRSEFINHVHSIPMNIYQTIQMVQFDNISRSISSRIRISNVIYNPLKPCKNETMSLFRFKHT